MHDLCDSIVKNGLDEVDYCIQANVRGIASDETLVKKMADAGFKLVYLGIENVSREAIKFLLSRCQLVKIHSYYFLPLYPVVTKSRIYFILLNDCLVIFFIFLN